MKKALLTKLMLLLCALIAGSSSVWATTVTRTENFAASSAASNAYECGSNATTSGMQDDWNFAWSPSGSVYVFQSGIRLGKSNGTGSVENTTMLSGISTGTSITIKVYAARWNTDTGNLTVSYNGNSESKAPANSAITATSNTYSSDDFSSSTNFTITKVADVTSFSIASSSKRIIIDKVEVVYDDGPVKSASNLALTGAPIALTFDLYNNSAAQTVNYTTSSTGAVTISGGDGYVTTSVDANNKTITVTPTAQTPDATPVEITVNQAADNSYNAGSKTFTVAITNSDPDRAGSVNNPYTVAQARSAIDAGVGVTGVFVTGKICQIDYVNTDDGKKYATYWISADGTTSGDRLEAYQGKFTGNTDFESNDQIGLFDQVTITGNLTKYNSTYEFTAGNYIYSRTPDARSVAGLAWSDDAVEIDKDAASYVLPSLTNPHGLAVTYNITGTAGLATESVGVITVDTSIEGTATVTASFAGDENYKPASVSYTITVVDPNKKGSINNPYTVADVLGQATATTFGNNIYVTGYIVGNYNSTAPVNPANGDTNLALADASGETDGVKTIPVEIPSGTVRTNWGPQSNNVIGYKVIIKGNAQSYFSTKGIKSTSEINAVSIPVTPAKTYTTLTSKYNLDFTGLSLEAYIVTDNDASDGYVTLTKVDKVPAGTGLVLVKTSGTSFDVPVFDGTGADDVTGNLMAGSATATTAVAANAGYILKDGAFHPSSGGDLPAGKAYLNVAASAPVLLLNFDGDVTGVNEVRGKMEDVRGGMYDLQGRKVAQPSKGLYIVNGKKYVVK